MLAHHPPGAAAHLGGRQGRGIIDIQRHVLELVHRGAELGPVLLLQLAVADAGLVYAPHRGQHPDDQRIGGHFHAEHQDGFFLVQDGVFHQVHGKTGLAHGGPPRHDDQVGGLQAGGHAVQVLEAGAQPGDISPGVEQLLDAADGGLQQRVDPLGTTGLGALLGYLHDAPLGFIDQLIRGAPLGVEAAVGDFLGGLDQLAQAGALTDHLGIGADIRCAGGVLGKFRQVGQPPGSGQLAPGLQLVGHGNHVHGLGRFRQPGDLAEYQAMVRAVKIAVGNGFRHRIPTIGGQQQATQHGLLGLNGMGLHLDPGKLAVPGMGHLGDIGRKIGIGHGSSGLLSGLHRVTKLAGQRSPGEGKFSFLPAAKG